jgi:hypothetical protein
MIFLNELANLWCHLCAFEAHLRNRQRIALRGESQPPLTMNN